MLINQLWKIPFLRFILPFIAGILLASSFSLNQVVLISLSILFIGLSFVYRPFLNHEQSYHKRWVFGVLITVSFFFSGAYLTTSKSNYQTDILKAETIIGIISEPPKETEKAIKLQIRTTEFQANDIWIDDESKLLIYIEKDSVSKTLQYGDMLLLKGGLKEIQNAGNPHEFDYKKYLSRKQIYFQAYQNASQWQKLSTGNGNRIYSYAYNLRNNILAIYKSAGIKGDEFAILAALTLGVKDYLSDEIVEAYSNSGAMHVLAVSGLHVGILTIVLGYLLYPLKKRKKLRIIYAVIVILCIWVFALITGLAPSVTRASIMFTFVTIGKASGRKPSIYNTLAASAFLILLANPLAIFHVGFQLSYLAVISIVFFQPKIYRIFDIKNKHINYVWKVTAVSIAAQIGTAPISIFYFHQFPVYSVITNFIAIHAAVVIMVGAIILVSISFINQIIDFYGTVFSYIIEFTNKLISLIEEWPHSSIEYISLSNLELLFLYSGLLLTIFYFTTKKKKLVFTILALLVFAFGARNFRYYKKNSEKQFIVLNTTRKSSFATISDKMMILYTDSTLVTNKKSVDYLSTNIITNEFVSDFEIMSIHESVNSPSHPFPVRFIQVDTLKIAYLLNKTDRFQSNDKLRTNFLVINKNSSLNIDNLMALFSFEKIIIDSSVPKWKQQILKKDCKKEGIPYHNVSESGAFVWNSNTN